MTQTNDDRERAEEFRRMVLQALQGVGCFEKCPYNQECALSGCMDAYCNKKIYSMFAFSDDTNAQEDEE